MARSWAKILLPATHWENALERPSTGTVQRIGINSRLPALQQPTLGWLNGEVHRWRLWLAVLDK